MKGDQKLWTALHYAAHYGHKDIASILLEDEKTHHLFERLGWTPLHAAIEQEHVEVVRLFANFAKSVSKLFIKQREGQQLTYTSAPRSIFRKAQGTAQGMGESSTSGRRTPLLATGTTDESVQSPLYLATYQGYIAGVDALMAAGVTPEDVKICIQLSFEKSRMAIFERLVLGSEQHIISLLSLMRNDAKSSEEPRAALELLLNSFPWNKDNILVAMK